MLRPLEGCVRPAGPTSSLAQGCSDYQTFIGSLPAGSTILLYSEFKYIQNSRRSLSTVQFTKDTQNSRNPGGILHAFHPLEKKIVVGEDLGIQLGIKKKKMARLGRQTRPTWGAFCCSHACFKLHIFIGLRSTLLTPTSQSRIYSSLWHFTATTSLFLLALSSSLFPISMSHTPT
jgi:hypothetical protein